MLCPAQTATVTSGGAVTINISACEFPGNGGIGPIDGGSYGPPDFENHGTATTRQTSGQWFLDYSHNGSTGIGSTDVFEVSDGSLGGDGDILFTITINPSASPITVTPASLPTLTAGAAFSQTLSSSGGLAPYTYAEQSGVLPPGLSLTSGGVLSGTPTQRGAYSFSVRIDRCHHAHGAVRRQGLHRHGAKPDAFAGIHLRHGHPERCVFADAFNQRRRCPVRVPA